jgi:hypothetical protein
MEVFPSGALIIAWVRDDASGRRAVHALRHRAIGIAEGEPVLPSSLDV